MDNSDPLLSLLDQVRNRDDAATEKLIRSYERVVRVALQRWRRTLKTYRVAGESDIVQDTFRQFVEGLVAGHFHVQTEDDLRRLLSCIAERAALHQFRWEHSARRDARRTVELPESGDALPDPSSTCEAESPNELLESVLHRLPSHDAALVRRHLRGVPWKDLAAEENTLANVLRMRLLRRMRRVADDESRDRPS